MSDDAMRRDAVDEVRADLRHWRAAHPQATFAEMEAAVEERLGAVRAALLADAGLGEVAGPLSCSTCATPLQTRGRQTREVRIAGDARVRLDRPYTTCPACGQGLFPPR
jgi:hypothetical protein